MSLTIPSQQLPYWMRQSRKGVDWGVLLAALLGLAMAWPFLLQSGLPRTNASESYVFRTADTVEALREGRLYPRWSPHVEGGYGAPIPHYYPPGAPYFAALIQLLFTGDSISAVRLVYIIALLVSCTVTYTFVMRRAGAAAGLVAAVLYTYSPYIGTIAPHILGELPDALALALLPCLLWSVQRLLLLNRAQDFAAVVLSAAAGLLSDPRIGGAALMLALIFVLWETLTYRPTVETLSPRYSLVLVRVDMGKRARFALAALFAGAVLPAFYALPALLEWSEVRWIASPLPAPNLRITLAELFLPMRQIDLGEFIPTPHFTLGLPLALSIPVTLTILIRRRLIGFQTPFAAAALLALVVILVFPTQIWLLGVLSFCLAVSYSVVFDLRARLLPTLSRLLLPVLLMLILAGALPVWLAPLWSPDFGEVSPQAQIRFEEQGFGVAVLPQGAAIPLTIDPDLVWSRFLRDGYQTSQVERIVPTQVRAGVQITTLLHTSHRDWLSVRLNQSTSLDFLLAYFPGWQSSQGRVTPDPSTGLITLSLPSGSRDVLVSLEGTPVRFGAWVISWSALIITGVIVFWRYQRQRELYDDLQLLSVEETRLLGIVLGGFLLILALFVIPNSPLQLRAPVGHALIDSIGLRRTTDSGLQTLAYQLDDFTHRPGDVIPLTLYWRTPRYIVQTYHARLYLLRADNPAGAIGETPLTLIGSYPTRRWTAEHYITDPHPFEIPFGLAPGQYRIALEVYPCEPFCQLEYPVNFFDSDGTLLGTTLLLPTPITITR